MNKIFFLLLLSFGLSFSIKAQLNFTHNGANYQIVQEFKTWEQAAAAAVQKGGFLVQIEDQAEQTAIYTAITNAGISTTYTAVSDGGGTAYIWIGATDKANESTWLWDGDNNNEGFNFFTGQGNLGDWSAPGYNNWGGSSNNSLNEPDDFQANQDAAAIALAKWPTNPNFTLGVASEWNDININNQLYYIIEFPVSSCQTDDLIVNDTPIPAEIYETTGTISSTGTVNSASEVIFKSAQSITLLPNFHAVSGANFSAVIEDCSANTIYKTPTPIHFSQSNSNEEILEATDLTTIEVYPNPFHYTTLFSFHLQEENLVNIRILDINGKEVDLLVDNQLMKKGPHQVVYQPQGLQAGMYYVMVQAGKVVQTKKMVLLQ